MTFDERLKFYQELDADKFADWMMDQHPLAAKLLNREVLAVCWNRGVEASMATGEQWRPVLALWYACGMVQGLLSAIDAMYECQAFEDVWLMLEALQQPFICGN